MTWKPTCSNVRQPILACRWI